MLDVKKAVSELMADKEVKNVSFAGCGGSLACFYPPYYYLTHESKTLTTNFGNANEFANITSYVSNTL